MIRKSNILSGLVIICISGLVCGCSAKSEDTDTKINFSINDNTVHSDTVITNTNTETEEIENTEESKDTSDIEDDDTSDGIGELVLENADTSKTYEVSKDGNDVIYKEQTFKNLKKSIDSVDTKYSEETLINFIIKTCTFESKTIYCIACNFGDMKISDDDICMTPVDELKNDPTYKNIKSKHNNKDIKWSIEFIDADTRDNRYMYGCKEYILLSGVDSDVLIDMDEYDSKSNKK